MLPTCMYMYRHMSISAIIIHNYMHLPLQARTRKEAHTYSIRLARESPHTGVQEQHTPIDQNYWQQRNPLAIAHPIGMAT